MGGGIAVGALMLLAGIWLILRIFKGGLAKTLTGIVT